MSWSWYPLCRLKGNLRGSRAAEMLSYFENKLKMYFVGMAQHGIFFFSLDSRCVFINLEIVQVEF